MPGILDEILENKRCEVSRRKEEISLAELKERSLHAPVNRDFLSALKGPGVSIIAEIKPRSPSSGTLRDKLDLDAVLAAYSRYARAVSVLTDEKYFGGSMELLASVCCSTNIPALCKDFIIDEHQCYSARLSGASAVLLIVKALDDGRLKNLQRIVKELNMVPVVEVQNERELERALAIEPDCVLVNNRNLDTMQIDLKTSEKLIPKIPGHIFAISASGIAEPEDIVRLLPVARAFLIGSSLMLSENIEGKLASLVEAASHQLFGGQPI